MRDLHQGLDKADELSGATRERRASSPLIALHADRGSGHDGGAPRDAALRPSSRSASGLVGSPAFDRGPEPTLEVLPSLLPAQQRAWAAAGQRAYGNRAIASMLSRVPDGAVLSRKCASCKDEDEDEDKRVSRSAEGAAPAAIPAAVHRVLDAPGAPLAASVRSFMEPRFGALLARTGPLQAPSAVRGISVPDDPHEREADRVAHTIVNARVRDDAPRADLGDVRVHAGADAAAAARAVSAEAFSVGSHIVLGAGHEPASATRLLAHELTHVVQGSGATPVLSRTACGHDGSDTGCGAAMGVLNLIDMTTGGALKISVDDIVVEQGLKSDFGGTWGRQSAHPPTR